MIIGTSRKFSSGASLRTVNAAFTTASGAQSYAGVAAAWDPSGTITKSFQAETSVGGGATSTATGAAIGTAGSNRTVIVSAQGIVAGTTPISGSLTIGGVSATKIAEATGATDGNGDHAYAGLFALSVPSGTTANIVMTWGGQTAFDGHLCVYAVYNLGSSRDTNSFHGGTGSASITGTLDVHTLSGGLVIAADMAYSLSPDSQVWTGVTQDSSASLYGNDLRACASAIA
jgi:hypothetical protein